MAKLKAHGEELKRFRKRYTNKENGDTYEVVHSVREVKRRRGAEIHLMRKSRLERNGRLVNPDWDTWRLWGKARDSLDLIEWHRANGWEEVKR